MFPYLGPDSAWHQQLSLRQHGMARVGQLRRRYDLRHVPAVTSVADRATVSNTHVFLPIQLVTTPQTLVSAWRSMATGCSSGLQGARSFMPTAAVYLELLAHPRQ